MEIGVTVVMNVSQVRGCSQTMFTRRPTMSIFCQRSYHRKCQRRGVGSKKIQNLVNVVCERPLT